MSDKATIFEAQCEVLHVYYNNAENKLVCTNCLFITTNTRVMMHHVGCGLGMSVQEFFNQLPIKSINPNYISTW